jgi:transcriptional regulator with XRE-family HTH domain
VSLPYLNQMENNHRPVSAAVVLALAQEFGLDVTELTVGESERLVTDMREALADPVFTSATPPVADLRLAASNAPALARAFPEPAPRLSADSRTPRLAWTRRWARGRNPAPLGLGRGARLLSLLRQLP